MAILITCTVKNIIHAICVATVISSARYDIHFPCEGWDHAMTDASAVEDSEGSSSPGIPDEDSERSSSFPACLVAVPPLPGFRHADRCAFAPGRCSECNEHMLQSACCSHDCGGCFQFIFDQKPDLSKYHCDCRPDIRPSIFDGYTSGSDNDQVTPRDEVPLMAQLSMNLT